MVSKKGACRPCTADLLVSKPKKIRVTYDRHCEVDGSDLGDGPLELILEVQEQHRVK